MAVWPRLARTLVALAAVVLAVSASAATPEGAARSDVGKRGEGGARQAALTTYGALPLAFVRNAGQLDHRVRYSAQVGGASVFLTRRAAILSLAGERQGVALRLAFLGASPQAKISGARRGPARVSYLIGNDPSRWRRNLPTYAEVVYHDLWPGIDLAVRGRGGQLKYEFRLAPGADPAHIKLAYRGQERLSLDRDGSLRVETALGLLRDGRPVSYQPIAGRRVAVESGFSLGRGGAYRFALGAYDRRHALVIDPGLVYSTYLGGTDYDSGRGIAVDAAGSAYVTGETGAIGGTGSSDFPSTAGAFDKSYSGGSIHGDAFVTKLKAAGSALVYSTYVGGRGDESGDGIAVDNAGSVYVTGLTNSKDFPTTVGAFDRDFRESGDRHGDRYPGDAFVTKLNRAGSALVYSTYLGSGYEWGSGIAVDSGGSAYVTGRTGSRAFPTTVGAFDRSYNGGQFDIFVTKLDAAGSALVYSTYLGGSGIASLDESSGLAVDSAGSAYVTGATRSRDFPTTAGAFDRSYNGGGLNLGGDAFVTKLNAAGSGLVYSTYLGGGGSESGGGIAVDARGHAYVTGGGRNPPVTAGAFDTHYNGGVTDAFVTKLNPTGSALVYSTYLGGGGSESGSGIAVDGDGAAYVTGGTASTNFPTTASAFNSSDTAGVFVTKLNAAGSALVYSTYLGGAGIALDGAGRAYLTGGTGPLTGDTGPRKFPTTSGAFDRSFGGGYSDAFVTKLDPIAASPSPGFSIGVRETLGAVLIVVILAALVAFLYLRVRVRLVVGRD